MKQIIIFASVLMVVGFLNSPVVFAVEDSFTYQAQVFPSFKETFVLPFEIGKKQLAALHQFLEDQLLNVGRNVGSWFSRQGTILQESVTDLITPSPDLVPSDLPTPEEKPPTIQEELDTLESQGLQAEPKVIEKTIVERTIERIISGLSQQELDLAIQTLNNKFLNEIAQLKALVSSRADANFQAIALTNNIDSLSSVTLTSATVSGVSGLTDGDIPNDITISSNADATFPNLSASGILTVSGTGTSTFIGSLAHSSGDFVLARGGTGNLLLNPYGGNVGIGTTTSYSKLTVWGDGTSGASAFEVVDNASTTLFTVLDNGNVGIGTTSPWTGLSVAGDIVFTGKLYEDGAEILSGMITPFASACPTGWTEYTTARGRYIVGTPDGVTNIESTIGNALTDLEDRTHIHSLSDSGWARLSMFGQEVRILQGIDGWTATHITTGLTTGINGNSSTVTSGLGLGGDTDSATTSSPYVQLTFCQKTAGSDIAEWTSTNEILEKATIVSIDTNNREKIVKSKEEYDSSVIGIISTSPDWIIGTEKPNSSLLALSGRVPVKVSLKNETIKPGDPITTSSIPGVGMKATKAGPIVGKAMDFLNETSSLTACLDPKTGNNEQCGIITVFVNVSWYDPLNFSNDPTILDSEISNGDVQLGSSTSTQAGWTTDSITGRITSFYTLDMTGQDIVNVRNILSASGTWSITEDGTLAVKKLVAEDINTQTIKSEKGYTILDDDTGEIYCIKIKSGELIHIPGECSLGVQHPNGQNVNTVTTFTSNQSTTTTISAADQDTAVSTTTPDIPTSDTATTTPNSEPTVDATADSTVQEPVVDIVNKASTSTPAEPAQ